MEWYLRYSHHVRKQTGLVNKNEYFRQVIFSLFILVRNVKKIKTWKHENILSKKDRGMAIDYDVDLP